MIKLVFSDQTNHYDTLLGRTRVAVDGQSSLYRAVAVLASYRRDCLLRTNRLQERRSIQYGNLIELNASVLATDRRPMTVTLHAEELLPGERGPELRIAGMHCDTRLLVTPRTTRGDSICCELAGKEGRRTTDSRCFPFLCAAWTYGLFAFMPRNRGHPE